MNLIDRIDNYLVEGERRERVSYYPSEVSKCLRQLYYKFTKEPETNPISPGGFWKMRMGDKIHDLIFEFLEKSGLEIVNEIGFKEDIGLKYPISGRMDNLFIDEDDSLSGIEVKSTYGAGIRNIVKKGYPKEQDIEQILVYMGCTNVERFYLIYLGRDDGYRTQYIIERNNGEIFCNNRKVHTDFGTLTKRFAVLEEAVTYREIPNREYLVAIKNGEIKSKFQKDKIEYKSDWQCLYCQFMIKCWEGIVSYHMHDDNSDMFKNE